MYNAIGWFILRAIFLYALLFWGWSYIIHDYMGIVTPLVNKELQILGVANITQIGPSRDPRFDVAVYHRDAAGMDDSLFDFKLESIRSHFPMLFALILAMPVSLPRKLKAVGIGILIMYIVDSLAVVIILTWSYSFLPDHHAFTPFSDSAIRDSIVSFFYNFYNAIGVGVIPIVVWAAVSLRRRDFQNYLDPIGSK
ncbi:MAG: hypothetical protein HYR76_00550 [Ignavibacteria bacterium]|nr:hypothetical protein [Ignavibacteria bacterium]